MAEVIEIHRGADGELWDPFVGEETNQLLRSKGFDNADGARSEAGRRILEETYHIMQSCSSPHVDAKTETGIVIGYVQSGKTLSFTTLTAMARDNDFKIVIVIAGTSVNLVNQSTDRLKRDLRLDIRSDRKWTLLENPSSVEHQETIGTILAQWLDPTFPKSRCRTVLITVMKNGAHLRKLAQIFSPLSLDHVPTLIIDDEGDQASLNTRAAHAAKEGIEMEDLTENDVSTIYRRLTDLRGKFPNHTFLQYTATPQANLFINIMDRLSPNFIRLLTPGEDYTGGYTFFKENTNLVVEIPLADIPTPAAPLHEPPETLLRAMRIFYLGVAAGEALKDQDNRSMLIHPSRLQEDHSTYFTWANAIKDSWRRLLAGEDNHDRQDLLREFETVYVDLQMTVRENLPSFEELSRSDLVHAIQYTPIVEVNARRGKTPHIDWKDTYSWILVGGQSMDRGFTVEGLTVTYMPRDLGLANVDTILQRARFFGYKRSYLGFCRVFLPEVTIDAFRHIVDHEQDVRLRLQEFDVENKSLNDWDREAVLDQMLNLTRSNVLYDGVQRNMFGDDWVRMNAPHDTDSLIAANLAAINDFFLPKQSLFQEDEGNPSRTPAQKHLVARMSLKECLDGLLNKLKFTRDSDSATYSSLRGIIKRYLEQAPDEECYVYLMSTGSIQDWEPRERALDKKDQIQQLFQGRNPKKGRGQMIYPGDSEIKVASQLSIQVHLLDLKDDMGAEYHKVPTLAIWVPDRIGADIIRQTERHR